MPEKLQEEASVTSHLQLSETVLHLLVGSRRHGVQGHMPRAVVSFGKL